MPSLPPIHHVGYVVDDVRAGAERFARDFGAGPFFLMEHLPFDEVTYLGGPAVYDHSSALGAWGEIIVEVTEAHDVQPDGFRDALVAPGAGVGHIGFLVDSVEQEAERMAGLGMTSFHTGRSGPAHAIWLDGAPLLGHPVELMQSSDVLLRFYAMIRVAAEDWDGSRPVRSMPGPPE